MGWLTGQDKGTKARASSGRSTRARTCTRCGRALASGSCPVCSAIVRSHTSGRNAVVIKSYACTDGRVRVHRNGICGGPC